MADSKIIVKAGNTFSIHVAFMCSKENELVVMDNKHNRLWSTNSEKDEARTWTKVNTGSTPETLVVCGLYKDDSGQLLDSRIYESHGGPNSRIIGYEEDQDDDFNDCVASISF